MTTTTCIPPVLWRRSVLAAAVAIALAAPVTGCGDDGGPKGPVPLIDLMAWERAADSDDPFIDLKPPELQCVEFGYGTEYFEFEFSFFVDTTLCDFLTVMQPAAEPVHVGDTLHLRLYQWALSAPEPTQGYVAVQLGDDVAWDEHPDIPSDAVMLDETWTADRAIHAGDPVYFHVNNHGDNNWSLLELSVTHE